MTTTLPEVIVIGAGGHGVVVADALLAAGRRVLGFVDARGSAAGAGTLGLKLLGDDSALLRYRGQAIELANGIGGSGTLHMAAARTLRRQVQERLQAEGWTFVTVCHPQAVVSSHAELQPGCQVLAGAVVQPAARIAVGAIVNTRAVVEHHADVGAYAHVAPGAVLCGDVTLGEEAHVGAGAVVRQGLRLAARVLVAAGAAVVSDVDGGAVAGVPARPLHPAEQAPT